MDRQQAYPARLAWLAGVDLIFHMDVVSVFLCLELHVFPIQDS